MICSIKTVAKKLRHLASLLLHGVLCDSRYRNAVGMCAEYKNLAEAMFHDAESLALTRNPDKRFAANEHGVAFLGCRDKCVVPAACKNLSFLDYDKALSAHHVDYVFMWGNWPLQGNMRGLSLAIGGGGQVVLCEDGFLRSADTWANSKAPEKYRMGCSVLFDNKGFYFDATKETNIERMLNDKTLVLTTKQLQRARQLINRIVGEKLTKYNHQPIFSPAVGRKGRSKVLVVDQSYGDFSIRCGLADDSTFERMLADAIAENPDSDILVKTHPDAMTGTRKGYYDGLKESGNLFRVTMPINPYSLLEVVDKVYVCTTQFGFEALMAGKEVHVYGMPFYAGWGITKDTQPNTRRTNRRSLDEIFYIFYLMYTYWINPEKGELCTIDEAIDYLLGIREEYAQFRH